MFKVTVCSPKSILTISNIESFLDHMICLIAKNKRNIYSLVSNLMENNKLK